MFLEALGALLAPDPKPPQRRPAHKQCPVDRAEQLAKAQAKRARKARAHAAKNGDTE